MAKEAPITPVVKVKIAVNEGIPPINSLIPIAIGVVTLLGNKLRINSSFKWNNVDKKYVINIENKDPIKIEITIAFEF